MATAQTPWLPADLQAQQLQQAQQYKLAQAMLGSVQAPQAQMVGGRYIAPGIAGAAMPLLRALLGQKLEQKRTDEQTKFLTDNAGRLGSAGDPVDLFKIKDMNLNSVRDYARTGNAGVLKKDQPQLDKIPTGETRPGPEGFIQAEYSYRNGDKGWETMRKSSPGTSVTVGTGKTWDKEGPKALIKQLQDERPKIEDATRALDNYGTAKSILGEGIITGNFADQETAIRGVASKVFGYEDAAVGNTQEMVATMGQVVMSNIKAFGSGTAISDADREYAKLISGASMNVKLRALQNLINIGEAGAANKITDYNAMVERVRQTPDAESTTIDALTFPAQLPPDLKLNKGLTGRFEPIRLKDAVEGAGEQPTGPIPPPTPVDDLRARFNKTFRGAQ